MPRQNQRDERAYWDGVASLGGTATQCAIWGEPGAWASRVPACLEAIVPAIAEVFVSGARVVDLGCGIGRLAIPIARQFPGIRVIGVDISRVMLDAAAVEAAAAGLRNVDWRLGDGRTLPPRLDTLDAAYSMILFQHIPREAAASYIRQLARHLRPGGRIRFQYVEGTESELMSYHATEPTMRAACETNGLDVVAVDRGLIYPGWTWITARKP